jgi:hypothetical protein
MLKRTATGNNICLFRVRLDGFHVRSIIFQISMLMIFTPSIICSSGVSFAPVSTVTSWPRATSSLDVSSIATSIPPDVAFLWGASSYICRILRETPSFLCVLPVDAL